MSEGILLFIEQRDGALNRTSFEALAAAQQIAAATGDKINAVVLGKGVAAVEDVLALVLEPDGTFSVITKDAAKEGQIPTSLADVEGVPDFSADALPETQRKLREAA